ncbi:VTT domain-containing protein [Limnobacter sp.]|uniref:VTT domain-containing protein n=1 Tax=Limnobacter sp. TaxID=2003368 RepID=UPI00351206F1
MSLFETTELLVFVNVLLQQLGAPVPAVPTMIVSAGLAGTLPGVLLLGVLATFASLIADWAWYLAGRFYGYKVLSALCRLSLNPESCVSQTESKFRVWGPWSLVVAKFIPGFSTVAPPIAGAVKMPLWKFTLASALGAFVWAMAALLTGWLFQGEVQWLLQQMQANLFSFLLVAGLVLGVWLVWKLSRRYAFQARLRMPKLPAGDVLALVRKGESHLRLLDLRPAVIQEAEPLAGWQPATPETALSIAAQWPRHDLIVTMCACPGDVSASHVATALQEAGYWNAKAMDGGYQAWVELQKGHHGGQSPHRLPTVH